MDLSKLDDRSWRAHFGMSKEATLRVKELVPSLSLKTLTITLYFLKVYPTEDVGATQFGVCRNTWRVSVRFGLNQLAVNLPQVNFFLFVLKYY